jgi:hypothetical protein
MERLRLRRRATCVLALGATALWAFAFFVGPASAQGPNAAEKGRLTEVDTINCDGSTPPGTPTQNFAIIKLSGKDGATVAANVTLKDLVPDDIVTVILIQTPSLSCGPDSETVLSNGQGNATVQISAPRVFGKTGAFVAVIGTGHRLVSEPFVFAAP